MAVEAGPVEGPFGVGTIVVIRSTGERGVVLRAPVDSMVSVAIGSGAHQVHADDLDLAEPEPTQLLQNGQLGDSAAYALRLQSLYLQHAYRFDPMSGLSNARIEPQPHQVFVAWAVNQKIQPRMILADEVGLGKTIEAGLIIKELRARGLANRVLVVCPASLQLQWQQELKTKFNEVFEIIDGPAVKHLGRGGANPWARHDSVICSLPFASHRSRADTIIETDWDLVVFDEAHRVRRWRQGNKTQVTQAYKLADELKELTAGVLFLTATPMQLDPYELYSLIEIIEPGLFPSEAAYENQRRMLPQLNQLISLLRSGAGLTASGTAQVYADHQNLLKRVGVTPEAVRELGNPESREKVVDDLAALHPLANVLVRNRKSEVGGFVGREAESVMVELTREERELYQEITDYCRYQYDLAMKANNNAVGFLMVTYQKMLASSSHAIRASFERRITKLRKARADRERPKGPRTTSGAKSVAPDEDQTDAEEVSDVVGEFDSIALLDTFVDQEIVTLQSLVDRLADIQDSKAVELLNALDRLFEVHPDEKVVIFTTFKETQSFLKKVLERNGHTVSVFHGSLSLDEKEEAVRAFRAKNRVLISTEAGGEGRNFQFCHVLVNYDLPWNPMKVEQRIGRLDRIGQKRKVQIWNLACEGTVEARVLDVLQYRIGLFEESVGSLDPILGTIEADLTNLVMRKLEHFSDEGETIELNIEHRVRAAREKERQLADFALDRNSFRHDVVNDLLEQHSLATHEDLRAFAAAVLGQAGGAIHAHSQGGEVITLSPQASQKLRVRGPTIRGCFDPAQALRLEELEFFAFGNQVVDRLIRFAEATGPTTAARLDPAAPAGVSLEVWYEMGRTDLKPSGRFMRHLIGPDLVVHSTLVKQLPPLGERAGSDVQPPVWTVDAIAASEALYREEFRQFREEGRAGLGRRKEEAKRRARRIFQYRQDRLEALIKEELAWIEKAERGTNERDKRILPARRGTVGKRREDLERLRTEHAEELAAIETKEPRTEGRVVAAGLVVGV